MTFGENIAKTALAFALALPGTARAEQALAQSQSPKSELRHSGEQQEQAKTPRFAQRYEVFLDTIKTLNQGNSTELLKLLDKEYLKTLQLSDQAPITIQLVFPASKTTEQSTSDEGIGLLPTIDLHLGKETVEVDDGRALPYIIGGKEVPKDLPRLQTAEEFRAFITALSADEVKQIVVEVTQEYTTELQFSSEDQIKYDALGAEIIKDVALPPEFPYPKHLIAPPFHPELITPPIAETLRKLDPTVWEIIEETSFPNTVEYHVRITKGGITITTAINPDQYIAASISNDKVTGDITKDSLPISRPGIEIVQINNGQGWTLSAELTFTQPEYDNHQQVAAVSTLRTKISPSLASQLEPLSTRFAQ